MVGREKELVRHLSEEELERLLTETDDIKVYKRLVFLKLLYGGATLAEAADDVGVSEGTTSNWVQRWNEGGLGKLTPNFGGGRPPKLDKAQREYLILTAKSS
jgi:transposase